MFDFSTHIPLHSAAFSIHFDCHERTEIWNSIHWRNRYSCAVFFLFWQIVTNCSSQIAADRPIPEDETGHTRKRKNHSFRRLSLLLLLMYAVRIFVSFSFHFSQNEFIIELIAVRSFVRFCAIDTQKTGRSQPTHHHRRSSVRSTSLGQTNACFALCVCMLWTREQQNIEHKHS